MDREKKVAAVVVTRDRLALLKDCVASLLAQSAACGVLVVDNASTDGTAQWLESLAAAEPRVRYRTLGSNTGGAGGFNCGMRWAVEDGWDYVWIMDDDCRPAADALEKLLEADGLLGGPGQYGFISSAVLWTDGHECVMNRQKVSRKYYRYTELLKYGVLQVEQATFVSLLLPAETVRAFGLPIREYFIWGDDIEYTRRIAVRGRRPCFMAGQSQAVHAMANNGGSNVATDALERLDRYRISFRNESYTYRREGLRGVLWYLARCGRSLWWILTQAKDHRLRRLGTLLKGMAQGLIFRPEVEHIR